MGHNASASGARHGAPQWDGSERRAASHLRLPPELERRRAEQERDAEDDGGEALEQLMEDAEFSGLERHRGPGRRLSAFTKAAEEGELTREQFLFVKAVDEFKRVNDCPYPSWTDILEIVRLLGYRKTLPSALRITAAEDFREKPSAPANVRGDRWADHARRAAAARAASAAQADDESETRAEIDPRAGRPPAREAA